MLKTRKLISLALVVALVLSVFAVGVVSTSAASEGGYYISGTMNGWTPTDGYKLTENPEAEGEYYFMGLALDTDSQFKVAYSEDGAAFQDTDWFPSGMGNNYGENGEITEAGTYNVYFRPDGNGGSDWHEGYFYVELAGSEPEPQDPTTEPEPIDDPPIAGAMQYYVVGSMTDWTTNDGYKMTKNDGADTEEYTFSGLALTTESQFKVVGDNASATLTWYPDGMGNNYGENGEITEDGTYTVYFRPNSDGDADWFYSCIYVAADEPVENPTEEPEQPTEEPEQPTDEPAEDPTEAPEQPGEGSSVKIDGETFDVHVGDTIHFTYNLDLSGLPVQTEGGVTGKANQVEGYIYYDKSLLKITSNLTPDDDGNYDEAVLPVLKDATVGTAYSDRLGFNASRIAPRSYDFSSEKAMISLDFEVIAEGTSEITAVLQCLSSGEAKMIEDGNVFEAPKTSIVSSVDCPHTQPTEEPEQPTEEPEQPTEEPEQPTDAPQPGKSTVTVIDWNGDTETKEVAVGDEITVTSYLKVPAGKKVNSIDVWEEFNIGAEMLEVVGQVKSSNSAMFPNLKEPTANLDGNIIKANQTKSDYDTALTFDSEDSILLQVKYNVIAEGNSTVKVTLKKLATVAEDDSMENQVSENQIIGSDDIWSTTTLDAPEHEEPTEEPTQEPEQPTEEPTQEPEQPTEEPTQEPEQPTEEPTQEPEKPTEEPFDGVIIIADGKKYQAQKGDVFNYYYYLNTGEQVCSLDAETFFDTDGVKLLTGTKGAALEELFPILKDSVVLNAKQDGRLKYNYSSASGKTFDSDDCVLIHAQFEVTAETGVYEINTYLHAVAGEDEHKYIFNDDVVDELKRSEGETDLEEYVGPVEKPTEEPEQPTDAPEQPTDAPEQPTDAPEQPTDAPEQPTEVTPTEETPTETPQPATQPGGSTNGESGNGGNGGIGTGTTEMAIIFLMVLVLAAGVVVFLKKKRFN